MQKTKYINSISEHKLLQHLFTTHIFIRHIPPFWLGAKAFHTPPPQWISKIASQACTHITYLWQLSLIFCSFCQTIMSATVPSHGEGVSIPVINTNEALDSLNLHFLPCKPRRNIDFFDQKYCDIVYDSSTQGWCRCFLWLCDDS